MSRIVFLILLLCGLTGPAFAQARFPFTAETVADRVNVRAGQNNNFESVAILPKGTKVGVAAKSFKWFKVYLPDTAKAYVKADYVKLLTPDSGEVLADNLNVRSAPIPTATTLGLIVRGQKVVVLQNKDGWLMIRPLPTLFGWINESLISFKNDGYVPPSPSDRPGQIVPAEANPTAVGVLKGLPLKPVAQTSLLKKSADGSVECVGRLRRSESQPGMYDLEVNNVVACFVDGPQSVLDTFLERNVRVQGRLKNTGNSADSGVVLLSKITLQL